MHAPTLPSVLRHTRRTRPHTSLRPAEHHSTHVAPPAQAAGGRSESPATRSWRISDLPERARIRPVRWLPVIVPGMALFLLACMALIGIVV